MATLRIVDLAPAPGGRFRTDGPNNGEWFREDILVPRLRAALINGESLRVELDGAPGYPSSFLEEAFGGLVRTGRFSAGELQKALVIVADSKLYAIYKTLIERHMANARKQLLPA